MAYETLIRVAELHVLRDAVIFDCSFNLADPAEGRRLFAERHIPGARYLHLDEDLAAPPSGTNGRHPLPDREAFAALLRQHGVHKGQQVVAYDTAGGPYAARLWWLLRWIGHANVAVLDGGLQAWSAAGLSLETGAAPAVAPGDLAVAPSLVAAPVSADEVRANIATGALQVLDARTPERFRGDPNPLDPVAGHIPGARNRFFKSNLGETGSFKPAAQLAVEFRAASGRDDAAGLILQCGSGVTACHNALALEIAGLPGAHLYPGSWSEWIADPTRPVATGEA